LKDAYDKVKAVRRVLRRARKRLSELQAQVTLASAVPSSTNVIEKQYMEHLDGRIQCLEAKKVTVDEQAGQYTDLVAKETQLPHGITY
jgi:BMFP domain-containing protein YqiC